MINKYVYVAFIIMISTNLAKAQEPKNIVDSFKISEIVDLDKFILIYAVKDNDIYRVLSKKNNFNKTCKGKIQIGKYSKLSLKEIPMTNFGKLNKYYCECTDSKMGFQYFVDGEYITIPTSYSSKAYIGLNLNGDCIE